MKHNWEYKRLGEVCDKGTSNIAQKDLSFTEDGYNIFGASGLLGKVDFFKQTDSYIGIVKDGSGVGRVNVYPAYSSLIGTMQYIIARDIIRTDFLAYTLKSLNLSRYASGAAIPHIYFRDYQRERVPVPPMAVQEQIVAELDKINEVIADNRELLKQLNALQQSIFYDTFGELAEEVELSHYVSGLIGGKSLAGLENCNNKVLKSGAISYDYFDENAVKNLPTDYAPLEMHKVKKGDVIISRMNTIELVGACAYVFNVKDNIYLPDRLWRIELNKNANPIFIWKSLISEKAKRQIRAKASGTSGSMKNISKPLLLSIKVKCAPLPLQEEFAKKIEAIEAQKVTLESNIKELQTLLDSRMDYWFN